MYAFNSVVADTSVTWSERQVLGYSGAFPSKFAIETMSNWAAPRQNSGFSGGVTFGQANKKGRGNLVANTDIWVNDCDQIFAVRFVDPWLTAYMTELI